MVTEVEGIPRVCDMKAKDRKRSTVSNATKRESRIRPEKNALEQHHGS